MINSIIALLKLGNDKSDVLWKDQHLRIRPICDLLQEKRPSDPFANQNVNTLEQSEIIYLPKQIPLGMKRQICEGAG